MKSATKDVTEFIKQVTRDVTANSGIILEQYKNTGLELDYALTHPWEISAAAMKKYAGSGLAMMNEWTNGGFVSVFSEDATDLLESPWTAAQNAAKNFKTESSYVMQDIASNVRSNVTSIITELEKVKSLYTEIANTTVKTPDDPVDNGNTKKGDSVVNDTTTITPSLKASGTLSNSMTLFTKRPDGGTKYTVQTIDGKRYLYNDSIGAYFLVDGKNISRSKDDDGRIWESYSFQKGTTYYKYAKGTLGTKRNEWAITDEPQFGDELTMYATPEGTLSFMRMGSTVIPADLTRELIALPDVVDGLMNMPKFDSSVNMVNNAINKPEIIIDVENFLKVDRVDKDTLPQLEAMMDKKIDSFAKQLNYSIKKFGR